MPTMSLRTFPQFVSALTNLYTLEWIFWNLSLKQKENDKHKMIGQNMLLKYDSSVCRSYFRLAGWTGNWVSGCNIWWLLYRRQNVSYSTAT